LNETKNILIPFPFLLLNNGLEIEKIKEIAKFFYDLCKKIKDEKINNEKGKEVKLIESIYNKDNYLFERLFVSYEYAVNYLESERKQIVTDVICKSYILLCGIIKSLLIFYILIFLFIYLFIYSSSNS
jgi:hypothetical protein